MRSFCEWLSWNISTLLRLVTTAKNKYHTSLNKYTRHRIVYGDLRTPNVLFDDDKKVKFIDFDWARRYDRTATDEELSRHEIPTQENIHPFRIRPRPEDEKVACFPNYMTMTWPPNYQPPAGFITILIDPAAHLGQAETPVSRLVIRTRRRLAILHELELVYCHVHFGPSHSALFIATPGISTFQHIRRINWRLSIIVMTFIGRHIFSFAANDPEENVITGVTCRAL